MARRLLSGLVVLLAATSLLSCSSEPSPPDAGGTTATPDPPGTKGAGASEAPAKQSPAGSRPNIVLLMTDDQSLSDLAVMPQTRRLIGDAGATFRRAFSNYPLCCPARATVLTGQYPHNHGVMGNEPPWGGYTKYVDEQDSLPVWLQAAGYRTALLGKYLTGYPRRGQATYVPPGWDDWQVPVDGTFNYEYRTVNENGRLRKYHQYQAGYLADRAAQVIREQDPRQPLFLWASFLAPHAGDPLDPDDTPVMGREKRLTPYVEPKHRDAMRTARVPGGAASNEADMSDKSPFMDKPKLLPDELSEAYQQRLESLLSVDEAVARIVAALRARKMLDNTLLVFVSDNGFLVGQHRWYHKVFGYEESIRVPMLMRGPGIRPGAHVDQQVSLADLSATIVAAAGAKPGHQLDGVDLPRLVADPSLLRNRAMVLEAGGWPFEHEQRLYRGVRTADDFVLLEWYDGTREAYDLSRDPAQLDGRIDPAERPRVPSLDAALRRLATCAGAGCQAVTGR
jgi:N-acetylglucosamine-6-sulfatase